ncbi:hypothetical protein P280DRAFT_471803 [Massarina eburnea CBS 473.64]|uniref:RRM domain-containing protein n=1 Tax=Massarina eburnea CBS 473.64 TaxID=1395130 RepID=A0A6A6RSX0_9PLEO|nr:hypothetical protein P280DRAFT_471803 [Massarina eburnea CBS 473.64]
MSDEINDAWVLENSKVQPQKIDSPPPIADSKKRKSPPTGNGQSKKQQKVQEKKAPENRAVYVTNLPSDATVEEIEDVFKRFGMIDQGVDGNPRIKMYENDKGEFNGEALVVYFKKDSVNLAITLLDGYEFRLGDTTNGTINIQEADNTYKKNNDGIKIANKLVRKERKAAQTSRAEMQRKLAEWSDNESEVEKTYAVKKNKHAKMCIIKKAFILDDLEEDVRAILEIKEDMRNAASKCGDVTKVVLYDHEPEGIVVVRFTEFEAAELFRQQYHGKRYNNDNLQVTIADDKPKFKKSSKGGDDSDDGGRKVEPTLEDYNSEASTSL